MRVIIDNKIEDPEGGYCSFVCGAQPIIVLRDGLDEGEKWDIITVLVEILREESPFWTEDTQVIITEGHPPIYCYPAREGSSVPS